MSRIEVAFIAAATALVAFAPTAHADEDSDFLGCLANHDVTYQNKAAMLDLFHRIQVDLRDGVPMPVIEHNLVYNFDVSPSIAQVDVECAGAATLMEGH
ncbi:MAG: hypothetical protein QJR12_01340 [Mycobacterium sp.]|uniref:hypothetical protein n=1 Tax=Mycobacterium sp. TaxID=1785 RepID=UPI002632ED74|nr:hypothetical protein [Mycobacterium sp.]MDI3312959.1 hypothetical protein [Mycobacterium sp.]